jgi:hypothetical protein
MMERCHRKVTRNREPGNFYTKLVHPMSLNAPESWQQEKGLKKKVKDLNK